MWCIIEKSYSTCNKDVCNKLSIPCIANTQLSDWGNKTSLQICQNLMAVILIVLNEEEAKVLVGIPFPWFKCQDCRNYG